MNHQSPPSAVFSASQEESRNKPLMGTWDEIVRFVLSGGLGSLLFYLIYELIYQRHWTGAHNSAFSWALAYVIAAWFTHQFHRRITFRWKTEYWESLRRTYAVYGVALIVSTAIQDTLTYHVGWQHRVAFLCTLFLTGTLNYFALRHWGFRR